MANKVPRFSSTKLGDNSFSEGMKQDNTLQFQKATSYRYSNNGRIFYNNNKDFSYIIEKGNKFSFALPTGYHAIGDCELPNKTVIFSTNETNSEIGYVTILGNGTGAVYTTVFNDKYDPNGELFGWSLDHKFTKLIPDVESSTIERVYATDNNTEPWRVNVLTGLQANSPEFVNGNYQPLNSGKYPWFYSVHSLHFQADIIFGRLKLLAADPVNAPGNCTTGVYQIAYRGLTRDGYATPWNILSRPYICTFDTPNGNPYPAGNSFSRQMQASNQFSGHGFTFALEDYDPRFYQYEFSYVYSIAQDATTDARLFTTITLSQAPSSTLTVPLITNGGVPIDFSEYNQRIIPVKRCASMEQKDNIFWLAGIETYGGFNLDVSQVGITNIFEQVQQDDPSTTGNTPSPAIFPFVNSAKKTTSFDLSNFVNTDPLNTQDNIESYPISNDYANFKGVQINNILKGYMPDETYPFAVMPVDIKGNCWYAVNIADKTIDLNPQYPQNTVPMSDPGFLQSIGQLFDPLDVTSILYDSETGKQKLGGFAIVRCQRIPTVLFQCVLFPTVFTGKSGQGDNTYLLPMPSNYFVNPSLSPDAIQYDGTIPYDGSNLWNSRPYTFELQSPDIKFGRDIYANTQQSMVLPTDQLKLLYIYGSSYQNNSACGDFPEFLNTIELEDCNRHYYTKNYSLGSTNVGDLNFYTNTYPLISTSPLRFETVTDFGGTVLGYDEDANTLTFVSSALYLNGGLGNTMHSYGSRDGWIIKGLSWKNLYTYNVPNQPAYYVANYKVLNSSYYNTNTLNARIYIGTGHFQPMDEQTIELATHPSQNNDVIFEQIEVFGGDTYPNIFDFTRLYPDFNGCPGEGNYTDYGIGLIIPLYSVMNTALRLGRSYAAAGTYPNAAACGASDDFPNGIQIDQPEEFNLNSVLLMEENTQFFSGRPSGVDVDQTEFPYRLCYSLTKTLGEKYDSYTTILSSNYGDAQGQYGAITGMAKLYNNLYILQERGFGRVRNLDRSALTTTDGAALNTGLGLVFDGIDYISQKNGTRFPYSIIESQKAIYWADAVNKCLIRFAQNGVDEITTIYEMKEWANETLSNFDSDNINFAENIFEHIHGVYDEVRDEVRWTFISRNNQGLPDLEETIMFSNNEEFKAFVGFFPDIPYQYINCNGYIFSAPQNALNNQYIYYEGLRGQWYDVFYPTELSFVVNHEWVFNKKFDNFEVNANQQIVQLMTGLLLTVANQNPQFIDFTTFDKAKYRDGFYRFPIRQPGIPTRLSGHYLLAEFTFTNADDTELIMTSNRTHLRYTHEII